MKLNLIGKADMHYVIFMYKARICESNPQDTENNKVSGSHTIEIAYSIRFHSFDWKDTFN